MNLVFSRNARLHRRLYVGDGASLARPLIRRDRASEALVGHTTIRAQLRWCAEGVLAVAVDVARDGQEVVLR